MQGIYIIRNKINGKFYLGSTINFHVRKLRHFNELRNNKHHSIHLQRAFNKYSEENFEFIIIETCENYQKREQFLLEKIDLNKNTYNVSKSASGGNMIENHPHKEVLKIERIKKLLQAPKRKTPVNGENNPNWKGGRTFCNCGSRINSSAKTCIKCQDKSGNKNPFYGKKHNKETKQKLSLIRKNTYNGNQEKPVTINNIEYKSVSEAARCLKVAPATILFRIKSENLKFKDYSYKENL